MRELIRNNTYIFPVGFEGDIFLFIGLIGRYRDRIVVDDTVTIAQTRIAIGEYLYGTIRIRQQLGHMRSIQGKC